MGAPELPNDPGDNNLHITHIVHHPPAASDDSDNESDGGAYEGYQPLAMDDHHADYSHMQLDVEDDNIDFYNREGLSRMQENIDENEHVVEVLSGNSNMPQIETADVEIEREVWNQPRPRELQIELDCNRTQEILSAMANFQLPNLAVPDWAAGVPEESWKEELLQRIRQRKLSTDNSKVEVGKESK